MDRCNCIISLMIVYNFSKLKKKNLHCHSCRASQKCVNQFRWCTAGFPPSQADVGGFVLLRYVASLAHPSASLKCHPWHVTQERHSALPSYERGLTTYSVAAVGGDHVTRSSCQRRGIVKMSGTASVFSAASKSWPFRVELSTVQGHERTKH